MVDSNHISLNYHSDELTSNNKDDISAQGNENGTFLNESGLERLSSSSNITSGEIKERIDNLFIRHRPEFKEYYQSGHNLLFPAPVDLDGLKNRFEGISAPEFDSIQGWLTLLKQPVRAFIDGFSQLSLDYLTQDFSAKHIEHAFFMHRIGHDENTHLALKLVKHGRHLSQALFDTLNIISDLNRNRESLSPWSKVINRVRHQHLQNVKTSDADNKIPISQLYFSGESRENTLLNLLVNSTVRSDVKKRSIIYDGINSRCKTIRLNIKIIMNFASKEAGNKNNISLFAMKMAEVCQPLKQLVGAVERELASFKPDSLPSSDNQTLLDKSNAAIGGGTVKIKNRLKGSLSKATSYASAGFYKAHKKISSLTYDNSGLYKPEEGNSYDELRMAVFQSGVMVLDRIQQTMVALANIRKDGLVLQDAIEFKSKINEAIIDDYLHFGVFNHELHLALKNIDIEIDKAQSTLKHSIGNDIFLHNENEMELLKNKIFEQDNLKMKSSAYQPVWVSFLGVAKPTVESLRDIARTVSDIKHLSEKGGAGKSELEMQINLCSSKLMALKAKIKAVVVTATGESIDNFSRAGMLSRRIAELYETDRKNLVKEVPPQRKMEILDRYDRHFFEMIPDYLPFGDNDLRRQELLARFEIEKDNATNGNIIYPATMADMLIGLKSNSETIKNWARRRLIRTAFLAACLEGVKGVTTLIYQPVKIGIRLTLIGAKTAWMNHKGKQGVRSGESDISGETIEYLWRSLEVGAIKVALSLPPFLAQIVGAVELVDNIITKEINGLSNDKKGGVIWTVEKIIDDVIGEAVWYGLDKTSRAAVRQWTQTALEEAIEALSRSGGQSNQNTSQSKPAEEKNDHHPARRELSANDSHFDKKDVKTELMRIQQSGDAELKQLSQLFLRQSELIKIKIRYSNVNSDISHYNMADNSITLSAKATDWEIMHEIAHSLTAHKIEYGMKEPLSPTGRMVTELDALRLNALQEYESDNKESSDSRIKYYLSSLHEFVAGIYSGHEPFIEFLNGRRDGNCSFWMKLKKIIMRMLGFESLYETSHRLARGIIENPVIDEEGVINRVLYSNHNHLGLPGDILSHDSDILSHDSVSTDSDDTFVSRYFQAKNKALIDFNKKEKTTLSENTPVDIYFKPQGSTREPSLHTRHSSLDHFMRHQYYLVSGEYSVVWEDGYTNELAIKVNSLHFWLEYINNLSEEDRTLLYRNHHNEIEKKLREENVSAFRKKMILYTERNKIEKKMKKTFLDLYGPYNLYGNRPRELPKRIDESYYQPNKLAEMRSIDNRLNDLKNKQKIIDLSSSYNLEANREADSNADDYSEIKSSTQSKISPEQNVNNGVEKNSSVTISKEMKKASEYLDQELINILKNRGFDISIIDLDQKIYVVDRAGLFGGEQKINPENVYTMQGVVENRRDVLRESEPVGKYTLRQILKGEYKRDDTFGNAIVIRNPAGNLDIKLLEKLCDATWHLEIADSLEECVIKYIDNISFDTTIKSNYYNHIKTVYLSILLDPSLSIKGKHSAFFEIQKGFLNGYIQPTPVYYNGNIVPDLVALGEGEYRIIVSARTREVKFFISGNNNDNTLSGFITKHLPNQEQISRDRMVITFGDKGFEGDQGQQRLKDEMFTAFHNKLKEDLKSLILSSSEADAAQSRARVKNVLFCISIISAVATMGASTGISVAVGATTTLLTGLADIYIDSQIASDADRASVREAAENSARLSKYMLGISLPLEFVPLVRAIKVASTADELSDALKNLAKADSDLVKNPTPSSISASPKIVTPADKAPLVSGMSSEAQNEAVSFAGHSNSLIQNTQVVTANNIARVRVNDINKHRNNSRLNQPLVPDNNVKKINSTSSGHMGEVSDITANGQSINVGSDGVKSRSGANSAQISPESYHTDDVIIDGDPIYEHGPQASSSPSSSKDYSASNSNRCMAMGNDSTTSTSSLVVNGNNVTNNDVFNLPFGAESSIAYLDKNYSIKIVAHGAWANTNFYTASQVAKKINKFMEANNLKWNRDVKYIDFVSCFGATGAFSSQAQSLANILNIKVRGYRGFVTPDGRKFIKGGSSPGPNVGAFLTPYNSKLARSAANVVNKVSYPVSSLSLPFIRRYRRWLAANTNVVTPAVVPGLTNIQPLSMFSSVSRNTNSEVTNISAYGSLFSHQTPFQDHYSAGSKLIVGLLALGNYSGYKNIKDFHLLNGNDKNDGVGGESGLRSVEGDQEPEIGISITDAKRTLNTMKYFFEDLYNGLDSGGDNTIASINAMQKYYFGSPNAIRKFDFMQLREFVNLIVEEATNDEMELFIKGDIPERFERHLPFTFTFTDVRKIIGFLQYVSAVDLEDKD